MVLPAQADAVIDDRFPLTALMRIARQASRVSLRYFGQRDLRIDEKGDGSDVTEADYAVDRYLRRSLAKVIGPAWPIISEETLGQWPAAGPHPRAYCSVDPIDGTAAFINHEPTYTILMAWIIDGKTVAAVHAHPALDTVYFALYGKGAWKQVGDAAPEPLTGRSLPEKGLPYQPRFLIKENGNNTPHLLGLYQEFMRSALDGHHGLPHSSPPFITVMKSLIPRLADIAGGGADIYVSHAADARPGKGAGVHDLAGWDLILRESGGALVDTHGRALDFSNPHRVFPAFIAMGDRRQRDLIVGAHRVMTEAGRFTPLP